MNLVLEPKCEMLGCNHGEKHRYISLILEMFLIINNMCWEAVGHADPCLGQGSVWRSRWSHDIEVGSGRQRHGRERAQKTERVPSRDVLEFIMSANDAWCPPLS